VTRLGYESLTMIQPRAGGVIVRRNHGDFFLRAASAEFVRP